MSGPPPDSLLDAVEATWPAAEIHDLPGWRLRRGLGGGKRVSAATPTSPAPDIAAMEAGQRRLGQTPLVMLTPAQAELDARLDAAGYALVDPVTIYGGRSAEIAGPLPPVSGFHVAWPPLEIQAELWDAGGIGPERRAVMSRVTGPKISVMGRINDRPAGTAFIAAAGEVAMLHALEVCPSHRRQGVAIHMMRAAGHWAQDAGIPWLSVLVTEANRPANALYRSLGLQPVGHYHYRMARPRPS